MNCEHLQLKAIKCHNYRIEIGINKHNGKPNAHLYKMLTSGKNKGEYKCLERLYFRTELEREKYVKEKVSNINRWEQEKKDQKDAKIKAQTEFNHTFKVGDILYNSWGYEQTNIDFYQIIEIKGKTAIVQNIGKTIVEGSEGFMCANVKPNLESKGNIEQKRIMANVYNNQASFSIKNLYPYTKEEKGVYCSWYA